MGTICDAVLILNCIGDEILEIHDTVMWGHKLEKEDVFNNVFQATF